MVASSCVCFFCLYIHTQLHVVKCTEHARVLTSACCIAVASRVCRACMHALNSVYVGCTSNYCIG